MPVITSWEAEFLKLQDTCVSIMERCKERIIQNHLAAGQKASGKTANSLKVTSALTGEGIELALWGRQFFQGLETGRKGGKVPYGFYYIIRQWVIDKGLSFQSDRERNTFAYFVSRKIAAEGTSLYRQGGRKDIYSPEVSKAVDEITQELQNCISVAINTIVINE